MVNSERRLNRKQELAKEIKEKIKYWGWTYAECAYMFGGKRTQWIHLPHPEHLRIDWLVAMITAITKWEKAQRGE